MQFSKYIPSGRSFCTVTIFRFPRHERIWAMSMMYHARAYLKRTSGLKFWKVTGSGKGFSPLSPDLSQYSLILSWSSAEAAEEFFTSSELIYKYRTRAVEAGTYLLLPYSSRGAWGGENPFEVQAERPEVDQPIAVLTRGAISLNKVYDFWKNEPAISAILPNMPGLIYAVGLGELPIIRQITFTIWENEAAMENFAAIERPHQKAATNAHSRGYFSESLFTRFIPVAAEGTIKGRHIAGSLP